MTIYAPLPALRAGAAAAFLALAAWPAQALTINLDFLAAGENFTITSSPGSPDTATAAGPTVGAGSFEQVVRSAADVWEDLIGDPGTLNVEIGWSQLSGLTTARATQYQTRFFGGAGKAGQIQFDNDRTWFLDPTPSDNSEYTALTVNSADLGGGVMTTGIEYSSPTGFAAQGRDLFTTAVHEFGHLVGFAVFTGVGEVVQDPLMITSGIFDGAAIDVTSSGGHTQGAALSDTLMYSSRADSQRRLVSQVDLAAIAELSGFNDVDFDGAGDPTAPVPLPAPILALGAALAGLGALRQHQKARRAA